MCVQKAGEHERTELRATRWNCRITKERKRNVAGMTLIDAHTNMAINHQRALQRGAPNK
jgi:hypothetical protein